MTIEQRILTELSGLRDEMREMRGNLMGSTEVNVERPHGRLPALEVRVETMDKRVKVLETDKIRYDIYGQALSKTMAGLWFLIGVLITELARWFTIGHF